MTSESDRTTIGDPAGGRTLSLYLPGSCEQFVDELRSAFARVVPGTEVTAARVAMTGTIAAEVLAGAPADVFLSANQAYIEQLRAAGIVPLPVPFARNTLAIFVRPDAADRVRSLDDLTREDVRTLVFPAANDPGGAYTVELFDRAGLTERMAEQQARGRLIVFSTSGPTMQELLASGEIDAFVAYHTLARRVPELGVVTLPPPLDMRDRIVFMAGSVVRDGVAHPDADKFIDLLSGPVGWAILAQHGFLPVD